MTAENDREKELIEFSKLTNDVNELIEFCIQKKKAFDELSDSYSILKLENLELRQKM